MNIGTIGIWAPSATVVGNFGTDNVAEFESLGYGAMWLGSARGDLQLAESLLRATNSIVIATGIVNIWTEPAQTVAASFNRLYDKYPGRFLLGLGAGHREHNGEVYSHPLEALRSYLDALDDSDHPVPADQRIIAALGPKALQLARCRSVGAHTYLATADHTRQARETLGADPILAPEIKVILESNPGTARALARKRVSDPYLQLHNYTQNLRRLGFDDRDFAEGGSDRLIDALVAWGDESRIAAHIQEHLDAGANHVCVQLLTPKGGDVLDGYRRLAPILIR
jgi:probable F420-dependent oxidoreductase